jgi:hypothetical protein
LHINRGIGLVALLQASWFLFALRYNTSGTITSTFEIVQLQGYLNWQNLSPPLVCPLMRLVNKTEP